MYEHAKYRVKPSSLSSSSSVFIIISKRDRQMDGQTDRQTELQIFMQICKFTSVFVKVI